MISRYLLTAFGGAWLVFATSLQVAASESAPDTVVSEAATLAKKASDAGTTVVVGREGWLYFAPELRHLSVGKFWGEDAAAVSRAAKPDQADPLPAILDFKAQLDRAGIRLILVPVPAKAAIYPEFLFSEEAIAASDMRIDHIDRIFFDEVEKHGIEVLDLYPEFVKRKDELQLYCRQDTHWSGVACELAAEILAAKVRDSDWYGAVDRRKLQSNVQEIEIAGDLRREISQNPPEKERLPLRFVGTGTGSDLEPVPSDRDSPVILLGDSHNLVFSAGGDMHAVGAGLPDQLALDLGFPVDLVAVRGSGATPARINLLRRARRPGYLDKKKIVIWCFTTREFTESSGWMKVPVVK